MTQHTNSFCGSVSGRRRLFGAFSAAVAVVAAVTVPSMAAEQVAAQAVTNVEAAQAVPTTVTTDVLPAPQIDGVVWAQHAVGDLVYAGGSFTSARPAGAAPGTQEQSRHHILAYDLHTGELDTSFAPMLNGVVKAITSSEDGQTLYVSGEFTSVDGQTRYRIAAFDATTGALLDSFKPAADFRIAAMAVHGNVLYLGGKFSGVNNQARQNVAAVDATTGALLPWNPGADHTVLTLAVSPDGDKVFVGGQFSSLGGASRGGSGFVDATTGQALPYQARTTIRLFGLHAGITAARSAGDMVFISGFNHSQPFPFEGTAGISWADGSIRWLNDCKGDTYDVLPVGDVLYSVGHAHDCNPLGGIPRRNPDIYQRALASTTYASPTGAVNNGGAFSGMPIAPLLHWYPELTPGTFTGTRQAAWSLAGADEYVLMGGEFTAVNGTPQQGLARFATRRVVRPESGPRHVDLGMGVHHVGAGHVAINFTSTYDSDGDTLTYSLFRDGAKVSSTTVIGSIWWNRLPVAMHDYAPDGDHTYYVRVTDSDGNGWSAPSRKVTVSGSLVGDDDDVKSSTPVEVTPGAQGPAGSKSSTEVGVTPGGAAGVGGGKTSTPVR